MRQASIAELPDNFTGTADAQIISRQFQIQVITPMFGGDAESWQINLKAPVRSQSVKGQLRFWWRTMQGAENPQELLYRENALWGGKKSSDTRVKSSVSIAILNQEVPRDSKIRAEMENAIRANVMPKYVLFPITEMVKKGKVIYFITEMQFTLQISYPKEQEVEVLNTLRLWVLFGGVGARTRRGTGSLYCEELLQGLSGQKALEEFLEEVRPKEKVSGKYPTLSGARLFMEIEPGSTTARGAWKKLLEKYGDFRQLRTPKGGGRRAPGRSYWPEPDAIRRVTRQHSSQHAPKHPDGTWFPRAAFGLPIGFKFKDTGDPGSGGQIDLNLNLKKGDRWPSPVILKAIQLPGGKVFQAALLLGQDFPGLLQIQGKDIPEKALPNHTQGKQMLHGKGMEKHALQAGETVYDALFRYLGLNTEVI